VTRLERNVNIAAVVIPFLGPAAGLNYGQVADVF